MSTHHEQKTVPGPAARRAQHTERTVQRPAIQYQSHIAAPNRAIAPQPARPTTRLHRPEPHQQRRSLLPWLALGGGVMIAAVLGLIALTLLIIAAGNTARIADGVQVAGVSLGGLSAEEAAARLNALGSPAVVVRDEGRTWPLRYDDFGVTYDVPAMLAAAEAAGRDQAVQPRYVVDLNRAADGLIALSDMVDIDAAPGNPPQPGRVIDIPNMLERLRADAVGQLADGTLELSMIVTDPPELTPDNADQYVGAATTHIVARGQELGLIAKQYGVSVADIVAMNDLANPDLLFVGQELRIPVAGEYTPSAAEAPPPPEAVGRSILVDTTAQRIYAYEDGQLVRSHLVSTGRPETPTVKGDYRVYIKLRTDDMSGDDYFLPDVPYTMYFYQGYAIHGTYWHNSFGRVMSHGCVNLPIDEAEWFYNFASVGTLVRVI
ncbi:MAG: L,D-transpeptidase family protein [Phototrophicaceae bacterium]